MRVRALYASGGEVLTMSLCEASRALRHTASTCLQAHRLGRMLHASGNLRALPETALMSFQRCESPLFHYLRERSRGPQRARSSPPVSSRSYTASFMISSLSSRPSLALKKSGWWRPGDRAHVFGLVLFVHYQRYRCSFVLTRRQVRIGKAFGPSTEIPSAVRDRRGRTAQIAAIRTCAILVSRRKCMPSLPHPVRTRGDHRPENGRAAAKKACFQGMPAR